MQCHYFDAGSCRSCTLMGIPYPDQLAGKDRAVRETLAGVSPGLDWLPPYPSAESGFRTKAKLVAGGRTGAVTLGILDGAGRGVDLRACGIHDGRIAAALPALAEFCDDAGLVPYDVPARRGELKHVLVTVSPAGDLMVRFVLRSTHHLALIRSRLPGLRARLPTVRVVSVNVQPEHKAVLEGDREIIVTDAAHLRLDLGTLPLYLLPNSFFQTNTAVAAGLYRQATEWIDAAAPDVVWDLYCGVGGFALHAATSPAGAHRVVAGIEIADEAIAAAVRSADELALGPRALFVAGDAASAAAAIAAGDPRAAAPDLVVVNPPRRGLAPELTAWLEESPATTLLYSSCNPVTLARDLAGLPAWHAEQARLFDMFPQTGHAEVLVRLARRPA